jgi:multidrug efflux system outer membrane protein
MRRLFIAIMAFYVAGCTMGPDYVRPPVPEPEDYREAFPPGESIANIPWWEVFGDTVLLNLVEMSLENNRNLRTTLARIDEARATLGIVRADLFPRINYAADGGITGNTAEDGTTSDAAVVLNASYIVDLWGRVRRSNEAAINELLATEEGYRSLTITLVSQVATAYLTLRDLDNRLDISERTVEAWKLSLEVIQTRFDAGMVSEVDVNQAQIQVHEAEAAVQQFARLRGQTENALSVLLGVPPMDIERGLTLMEQDPMTDLPSGLPSELLTRRPDILQAERSLHAQTARIGVASALRFPQFDLLGDLGATFNGGNTGFFNLGAQIFGPLFNSGEFNRRVDVEVARTEQLLNQYEQTILLAYREVDDAMIAVRTYGAEYEARLNQTVAAQSATDLSWVRYEGGMTSYLEVLDVQRSLFSAQLKASETRQLELTSFVRLYAALGGGWVAAQDTMGVFGEKMEQ